MTVSELSLALDGLLNLSEDVHKQLLIEAEGGEPMPNLEIAFESLGWDSMRIARERAAAAEIVRWRKLAGSAEDRKAAAARAAELEATTPATIEKLQAKIDELQQKISDARAELRQAQQKHGDFENALTNLLSHAPKSTRDRLARRLDNETREARQQLAILRSEKDSIIALSEMQSQYADDILGYENARRFHLEAIEQSTGQRPPALIINQVPGAAGGVILQKQVDEAQWTAYVASRQKALPSIEKQIEQLRKEISDCEEQHKLSLIEILTDE